MKATELKEELKKRGIPSTKLSKKQDIIDRLIEDDQSKSGQENAEDAHIETGLEEDAAMIGNEDDNELSEPSAMADQPAKGTQMVSNAGAPESMDVSTNLNNTQGDDGSKRKRRSISPALSASSVTKRLKTAEDDPVHLEDDAAHSGRSSNNQMNSDAHNGVNEANPHAATSALYINKLVRPLRKADLQEHLEKLSGSASQAIINLHVDALRSHALVLFKDVDTASLVRDNLHGTIFPDEPQRKPLWVGYVPSESVLEWIQIEQQSNTRPSSSQRFEVRYSTSSDGRVSATYTNAQDTLPIPKGPRAKQIDETTTPSKRPMKTLNQDHPFPLTNTEPRLYYKKVSDELIDSRLSALRSETSLTPDHSAPEASQLRRTAFQDGTDLVDAGPDHNPRRGNMPSGGRGGRGRGGGGGGQSSRGRWQGRDADRYPRPAPPPPGGGGYRDDGFRREYRDPAPYRDEYRGGGYRDDGPRYDGYRGGGAPYRDDGYYRGGPGEQYRDDGGYYRGGGGGGGGGYRDDGFRGGPDRYRDDYYRGGGGPPDAEWTRERHRD